MSIVMEEFKWKKKKSKLIKSYFPFLKYIKTNMLKSFLGRPMLT